MRIRKGGPPLVSPIGMPVEEAPWSFIADDQVTVGAAAGNVFPALGAGQSQYMAELRNVSTGGQSIRVGSAPKFTATVGGVLLMPGDGIMFSDVKLQMKGIASAAGGLLDRLVFGR